MSSLINAKLRSLFKITFLAFNMAAEDAKYQEIEAVIKKPESGILVDELNGLLNKSEYNIGRQEEWLRSLEEKPRFFKAVAMWGGSAKAFALLRKLFRHERLRVTDEEDKGNVITVDSPASESCRIAKRLLECVPKVILRKYLKGNILHALCDEGTGTMAAAILGLIGEANITIYLRESYQNKFPMSFAMNSKDEILLRLLVTPPELDADTSRPDGNSRDDGRRKDHVITAVKNCNLPFLKILLESYSNKQSLLFDMVYTSAAESGDMAVWKYLAGEMPELAKKPGLLATAVQNRNLGIVRHILENNPDIFNDQDQLAKTTKIAVDLARSRTGAQGQAGSLDSVAVEAEKVRRVSADIEDLILINMVRRLNSRDVKRCWPHEKGRAAKEVSLELDLRRPRNWAWFARMVETARSEVNDWQIGKDKGSAAKKHDELLARLRELLQSPDHPAAGKAIRKLLEAAGQISAPDDSIQDLIEDDATGEGPQGQVEVVDAAPAESATGLNCHEESEPLENVEPLSGAVTDGSPHPAAGNGSSGLLTPEEGGPADEQGPGMQITVASLVPELPPYLSLYDIDFQPYLKSVSIPDLDQFRRHENGRRIEHVFGKEVKYILDWLRFVKGVRKILKLRVLDSRQWPHSEEVIEEAIKNFHIEELDWKRLDLSARTIMIAANEAHTLHLHASGSWAPICQWTGSKGLDILTVSSLSPVRLPELSLIHKVFAT